MISSAIMPCHLATKYRGFMK